MCYSGPSSINPVTGKVMSSRCGVWEEVYLLHQILKKSTPLVHV